MYMHPQTHLWLQEQERERMLAQRALQRAAREGRDQHAGVDRGGINAFTWLRTAVSSALHFRLGAGGATNDLTGTSPA
jgi:hypothetical protein